ncbi:MAG TPA: RdgB/HAM1 family non-canonical purine NTP pyrophosphatase [Candidatus Limnocylindrales bacterium]|nr:RdgB/HAM1 family non-canonical purine NTP pyrophosphatase [Candidatus Limnocylindrales bacterium]
MNLLIGTTNPGKLREYAALLDGLPATLLSLQDVSLHRMDVEEPFDTFEGNALHKAALYAQQSGMLALADDTGLMVDALDGRPGVYSARYSGPGATDRDRYERILREMAVVPEPQRTARFVCMVAVVSADGAVRESARGAVEGRIGLTSGSGSEGFGYDSIFIPQGYDAPLSDIPFAEKNQLSHRANAVRALLPALRRVLETG